MESKTLRFDGRVAIVTGAGRGIGRAYAHLLAARGAKVVVNTRADRSGTDVAQPETVVEEIEDAGGVAVPSTGDVSDFEQALSIVATALESFGRVDIVVNNAGPGGVGPKSPTTSDFPKMDLAVFEDQLAVNLIGSFNVTQATWPYMVAQGYGRVVMTISGAMFGDGDHMTYASAKSGLIGLTRGLAVSGADHGIKVNAISPGAYTRRSSNFVDPETQRIWAPELVAPVVAFLAHESCPVSGEIYAAARGHVHRIFLGATVGYRSDKLTVEDVRDQWGIINDEAGYFVPSDVQTYAARSFATTDSHHGAQPKP